MFPKTMAEIGHLLADDAVVIVEGRVDKRDDTPKLIATDIELFEPMADGDAAAAAATSPAARLSDATVDRLKELLIDFPGESEVLHPARRRARCCACPTSSP